MKKLVLAFMYLFLTACGDITVLQNNPTTTFDQYAKSYVIGEKQTVYIGDPIVRWQELYTEGKEFPEMFVAKTDFKLKGTYFRRRFFANFVDLASNKNDGYYLTGTTELNNVSYYVIGKQDKEREDFYFLINKQGVLNKNVMIDEHLDRKLISNAPIASPEEILFLEAPIMQDVQKISKGISKELIFGGMNNVTLSATYREYSPADIARQAFFQNLVYQTGADTIRFQGFQIKVHEVTNEKISFTVLEDGLTSPIADQAPDAVRAKPLRLGKSQ